MNTFPIKPRVEGLENPEEAYYILLVIVIFLLLAFTLKYFDKKGS